MSRMRTPRIYREFLYGVEPCLAALKASRREIKEMWIGEQLRASYSERVIQIEQLAKKMTIPIVYKRKDMMNVHCGNRPHNGVILSVSSLQETLSMNDTVDLPGNDERFVRGKPPIYVAVDQVLDPQNLGSILRNCFYFGAYQTILSSKNTCGLSPTVSKASSGAMEVMNMKYSRSMRRFIMNAKEKGFDIVGMVISDTAEHIQDFKVNAPTVLIVSNENRGIRNALIPLCNRFVTIPHSSYGNPSPSSSQALYSVDSLNVSAALSVVLYQLIQAK